MPDKQTPPETDWPGKTPGQAEGPRDPERAPIDPGKTPGSSEGE